MFLNVAHHGSETMKILHSRWSKLAFNSIFFTFLSYWKTSDFYLVPEDFNKKQIVLKNGLDYIMPPPTTIHHDPPPPTTSQNISNTTHY